MIEKSLKIKLLRNGQFEIEALGYVGPLCEKAIQELIADLELDPKSIVVKEVKPEFYLSDSLSHSESTSWLKS